MKLSLCANLCVYLWLRRWLRGTTTQQKAFKDELPKEVYYGLTDSSHGAHSNHYQVSTCGAGLQHPGSKVLAIGLLRTQLKHPISTFEIMTEKAWNRWRVCMVHPRSPLSPLAQTRPSAHTTDCVAQQQTLNTCSPVACAGDSWSLSSQAQCDVVILTGRPFGDPHHHTQRRAGTLSLFPNWCAG